MTQFTFPTLKTMFAVAALVIAPAIASSMVHAETPRGHDAAEAVVRFDDLNLASAQGRAALKSRIAVAVDQVCGSAGNTTDLAERIEINKCRDRAGQDAFAAAGISEQALVLR